MNAPLPVRSDRGHFIQKVYETLRNDIITQRVRPGVKLIPEHIAASLNVSRTPVRNALERLCQEKYATRIPARGYFVAEMDAIEASDLYDVRYALEIQALETAMERGLAPGAIKQLLRINTDYKKLLDNQNVVNRSKVDQQFHLALAALSGNALIVRMLSDIFDRLNFRRRNDGYWFWVDQGARGHGASGEHRKIIEALASGKADAALAELRSHLGNAHKNYRDFLATVAHDG